jgi:ribosomal-protein-serine acetyltransferase
VERRELGDDLALRPFEERDADELFALVERSRAHLAPWMPWLPEHATRADSLRFIRETRAEIAAGTSLQLAIVDERERIVGITSLYAIDRRAGLCRCGYWLAPDAQERGIVTRAVASLLGHAFDELGLRRVELRTAPDNLRSRRVAERLGFRLEQTLPAAELFVDGPRDQVQYALEADAWRAQRDD